jgi:hypothetical protein
MVADAKDKRHEMLSFECGERTHKDCELGLFVVPDAIEKLSQYAWRNCSHQTIRCGFPMRPFWLKKLGSLPSSQAVYDTP